MTRLDKLLESIDPSRTTQVTEARADQALNTFSLSSGVVERWPKFQRMVTLFFCHLESAILRINPPRQPDSEFDWGRCAAMLSSIYGSNGWKAAFEMARTGNEHGLYGVLKALARRMAQDYGEHEVAARIGVYWNSLSDEERFVDAREYIQKHGHLLPSELTEGSAGRILADFPKVLKEHPRRLQRLQRVGR